MHHLHQLRRSILAHQIPLYVGLAGVVLVVALVVVGCIARVSIGVSVDISQCSAFNVQCLVVRNGEWNGMDLSV
jgi:hypothetical protein